MQIRWAGRMSAEQAARLAGAREAALEVLEHEGELWVRGGEDELGPGGWLARLPFHERYAVEEGDALVPWGKHLRTGRLPAGPWRALSEWAGLAPPTCAPARALSGKLDLRLVRGGPERAAELLRLPAAELSAWARTASALRLAPLQCALSDDGQALVRGTPLPPLAGRAYWLDGALALPLGLRPEPALESEALCRWAGADAGELVLLESDASGQVVVERVPAHGFVALTRSVSLA